MTALNSYSTGTVSVANGDTVIVGSGTIWSGVNARPGDDIVIDGHTVIVQDVTDVTHLVIDAWPFDTVAAGAPYKIIQRSPLRFVGGQAMADVSRMVAALNTDGLYVFVAPDLTEPDPSLGEENQFALQVSTGKLWLKAGGVWVFQGIYKGFSIKGPWSAATAYQVGDVVSLGGSSYVALLANTNQTPPNATYWQVLAAAGTAATVSVGTVTSVPPAVPASVTNVGTANAAVFDFGIPVGSSYNASSATSVAIGTGTKLFNIGPAYAYQVGNYVRASSATNGANYMEGFVTAYGASILTINVTKTGGSGTFADWNFAVSGAPGSGDLLSTNNLSDVAVAADARLNLGIRQTINLANGVDLNTVTDPGTYCTNDSAAVNGPAGITDWFFLFVELMVAGTNNTKQTLTTLQSNRTFVRTRVVGVWGAWKEGGSGGGSISPPQGRLTLTSGVAIMNNSVAAATTIYYTPAVGNQIPIFDGTNFVPKSLSELSAALSDATKSPAAAAANSVYDLFVWDDAGTVRVSRGPAWTNDGSRSAGTAIATVNGLWVNSVAITNGPAAQRGTYVGTIGTNATATVDYVFGGMTAGGLAGSFGVWNAYNRVDVRTFVANNANWPTFGTANSWRAAAGSATMRVTAVRGLDIDQITAVYNAMCNAPTGGLLASGIGLNTTTDFVGTNAFTDDTTNRPVIPARYDGLMGLGRVFVSAIEYNTIASTGGQWYGNASVFVRASGLHVELMQ